MQMIVPKVDGGGELRVYLFNKLYYFEPFIVHVDVIVVWKLAWATLWAWREFRMVMTRKMFLFSYLSSSSVFQDAGKLPVNGDGGLTSFLADSFWILPFLNFASPANVVLAFCLMKRTVTNKTFTTILGVEELVKLVVEQLVDLSDEEGLDGGRFYNVIDSWMNIVQDTFLGLFKESHDKLLAYFVEKTS